MRTINRLLLAGVAGALFVTQAHAFSGYIPVAGGVAFQAGEGLPSPDRVPGKEISFTPDLTTAVPPLLVGDPEQVNAWDGFAAGGGLADSFDYSGSRLVPGQSILDDDRQTDAIANHKDALFFQLGADTAHLIYSIDLGAAIPTPSSSGVFGGAPVAPEDIQYERRVSGVHGKWADYRMDINSDPAEPVYNVDGLEVWGGEPGTSPGLADANSYSHVTDATTGVSVWRYDPVPHVSTPYVTHAAVVAAVTGLLGAPTHLQGLPQQIDLDALMVQDVTGSEFGFEVNPLGAPADVIYFSIRQIPDAVDADGFFATGSEIFWLDATGAAGFLTHGGHVWDHAWTLDNMVASLGDNEWVQLDVDAIEAISTPEPTTLALLAGGLLAAISRRRRA